MSSLPGTIRLVEGGARDFGDFELLAKLGHGGMADVFLAARKAKRTELLVLKRLKADYVDDPEHRALFEDEARVAPLLRHPNIVRTWDSGEAGGYPYMAMEFLEGQALDRVVGAVKSLGPRAAVHVASEVLDGLHYVHELCSPDGEPLEIVHRDVSPHNVFLTYEGRVTLVDFGIAKSKARARQTATGVVRGKVAYMAPEQALCDEVDRRADVFAVAVVLWELLTGEQLWGDATDVQILKRMTFGEIPSLMELAPTLPRALHDAMSRALAPKPGDRFSTAREFRAALMEVYDAPCRRAELGAAVAAAAHDQQRAMRETIDAHLARAFGTVDVPAEPSREGEAPRSEPEPASAPSSTRAPESAGRSVASTSAEPSEAGEQAPSSRADQALFDEGAAPSARAPSPMPVALAVGEGSPQVSSRSRRTVWIAAAALVSAAGLVTVALWDRDGVAARSSETGAPSAPASSPDPIAELAPEQVDVRIEVEPSGAVATLDGMRIETPFSAKFPRDRVARRLRVEAPGFEAHTTLVVFDREQRLTVTLEPTKAEPAPSATPSGAAIAGAGRPRPRPGASAAPLTTVKAPIVDDRDPWAPKSP